MVVVAGLEVHQFGYGGLYGGVAGTDNTGFIELAAGIITAHLHAAGETLADVDDDLSHLYTLAEGAEKGGAVRRVAGAVCAQDDAAQVGGGYDVADEVVAHAREERDDDDAVVEAGDAGRER